MTTTPLQRSWIDLDGAVNVRDLGGLPVADGGATARDVLVRADNLQDLSARDVALLVEDVGVRVVVDLRTGTEVELEGPGPLAGDDRVEVRHHSLYPEAGRNTDVEVDDLLPWQAGGPTPDAETPAVRAYLGYLRDRPDSIVAALRAVAGTDGAVVVHCAAGKDRTGVVCALALEAVGVERSAVIADFAATAERLDAILRRLRSTPTYALDLDGRPAHTHLPRAETMERVLALIEERHGGPAAWLDEHGFGAADRAALRERLVG
ncbi:tyrosine-protein phosphatase [Capillimicrobium parvum]|uniref:Tyrosine specific protein phosphatases domain-containing protein n=1 Tax=Capillimicrobium parvum TaxID=2884022 RepID=A0A9E6Y0K7_9ACTN|nr:tyrosine-protein phosphatase [Capillimicrobium parvum]UGS37736.1 hypothetical protein DSM104329_04157 [Capillimicrobium parvum]